MTIETLPSFLIIGAGKAGTTSLVHLLRQHPNIAFGSLKEPHFFDRNWERGVGWYASLFSEVDAGSGHSATAIGEASVTYTLYPVCKHVPIRILETLGSSVKLIYCVRHPVERLLSHFHHDILAGHVSRGCTLAEAMSRDLSYEAGSRYHTQLERFLEVFASSQIRIVLFEDFVAEPRLTLKRLFGFLEVDESFVVPDLQARNVSSSRVRLFPAAAIAKRWLDTTATGSKLKMVVKRFGVDGSLGVFFGRNVAKPLLRDAEYNRLHALFRDEILALSDYLNRDLSLIWRSRIVND